MAKFKTLILLFLFFFIPILGLCANGNPVLSPSSSVADNVVLFDGVLGKFIKDSGVSGANVISLTNNSIADALHRHSELVASDGDPDPALSVDAGGKVGIGIPNPASALDIVNAGDAFIRIESSDPTYGSYIRFGPVITNSRVEAQFQFATQFGLYDYANSLWPLLIKNGNVGIGVTPNQKLTVEGTMSLKEQAAANADANAYGQIWVADTTPNELWFTDDAGTDTQLSSHPLDAPAKLYKYGPGIDQISKRVQKYLGKIYWQTLDGNVTVETFAEYNARTGKKLVKRDWNKVHREKAIAKYQKEEVEVPISEAIEEVEITEEIETGNETITSYKFNDKTGKVETVEEKKPIKEKQRTGKFHKQIKAGVRFNADNGKFYRKKTRDEAEAMVKSKDIPDMPKWIKKERTKI